MKKVLQLANDFIDENKLYSISYYSLRNTAEKNGYTIIEYYKTSNNRDVDTVINNLHLQDIIAKSNGFTFVNEKYRLIFIDDDLNEKEKIIVLAHELGHIACEHFGKHPIIGQEIIEEYEANEFAHYLLHFNLKRYLKIAVYHHKKFAAVLSAVTIIAAAVVPAVKFVQKQKSYIGDYYITDSGHRYHEKECIFIKNRNNVRHITQEEFESGEYDACQICLP